MLLPRGGRTPGGVRRPGRIGILLLDEELAIRRFSPEISHIFHIMEKDIVRAALRTAKKHNVTDKQWEDFIRRITKESD